MIVVGRVQPALLCASLAAGFTRPTILFAEGR